MTDALSPAAVSPAAAQPDDLAREHCALMSAYGSVQRRCSRLLDEQAARLATQERELIRLRAAVILRDSVLLWAQQDRAALAAGLPGGPKRRALARRVDALLAAMALGWRPVVAGVRHVGCVVAIAASNRAALDPGADGRRAGQPAGHRGG